MSQISYVLQEFQKIFLPCLEEFFDTHKTYASQIDSITYDMAEKLREFTLRGGKRIRPALLYYAYQCFSDQNLSELLKVGIACELMQSFLLIHDDIMDESELRRGGKTIHKIFSEGNVNDNRYGESIAILLGDLAGYLGIKAINSANFDNDKKCRVTDLYLQTCIDVIYGQALDLTHKVYEDLSETYIYNIYRYKTACYTTEFPLLCAASLTGQKAENINIMLEIGRKLGIIFQIQDDILGMFGDSDVIGKSTLGDLAQGKKTLLIWKAWESSNKMQKSYLAEAYGNKEITVDEAVKVREIIRNTGALTYAQNTMKTYNKDIMASLNSLNIRSEGREFISNLADYYISRNE